MKPSKRGLVSLSFATGFLGTCLPGAAFEARDILAFSAGPVVLRPHLNLTEEYNDNIFYDGENPITDWITSVNPGLTATLGRPEADMQISLAYNYNHMFYTQNDFIDDAEMHMGSLSVLLRGDRLSSQTSLSGGFSNTIYGGYSAIESGGFTGGAATVERTNYALSENLRYALTDRTAATLGMRLSGYNFQDRPDLYDSNDWRVTGGAQFNPREKLGFTAELFYGQQAVDPNSARVVKPPHRSNVGGTVGATGRFTERLSGTAKVGYQYSNQEDDADYPNTQSFGSPVADVSLTSKFGERTSATLAYGLGTGVGVQGGQAYVGHTFSGRAQHVLGNAHPIILSLGVRYSLNSYESGVIEGLDRNYFGVDASAFYQIKLWLRAGLAYAYQRSSSSSEFTVDYDVNQVTLTIAIGY